MTEAPYIPAKTAAKLSEPIPKGERHKAAMDIAFSLIGNGFSPNAVFQQLRDKFPADVSDTELTNVVNWAVDQRPAPSSPNSSARTFAPLQRSKPQPEKPKRTHLEQVDWWLGGITMTTEQLSQSSPLAIPDSPKESAILFFEMLYSETDSVNIVCEFTQDGEKANPSGPGKTMLRNDWVNYLQKNGVPSKKAGAWVRMNPCNPEGSGKGGAITDSDTAINRFVLLESDSIPLDNQIALLTKLKLPLACVLSSGGKSIHAWVRIEAVDAQQYKVFTNRILTALAPFGIDQSNKNSSRLSRLVGAVRQIQAAGDGVQRLLYLNPKSVSFTEKDLTAFEQSLELPLIQEQPLLRMKKESLGRYEEIWSNRGKLGVPTGIEAFDKESGGLKKKNMIVIAAETGGGKSTVALNFIRAALNANHGVALFSLEMDRDEIFDALVSMEASINRNVFNNGFFSDDDFKKINFALDRIGNYPLWIEDAPIQTPEDIRRKVLQLSAENKIGLVVVDYIQIVTTSEFKDNREQQIAGISRSLRSLAKEANVPIIVLSQINEDGKLRESRAISHDAHIVMLVQDLEKTSAQIQVKKGRHIRKGNYDLLTNLQYHRISSRITQGT